MVNITAEHILAVGTASAAVIAAFASFRNGRKVEQVHVLVNSKMTEAKNEIARLTRRLAALTGDTDDKQHAQNAASEASKLSKGQEASGG